MAVGFLQERLSTEGRLVKLVELGVSCLVGIKSCSYTSLLVDKINTLLLEEKNLIQFLVAQSNLESFY